MGLAEGTGGLAVGGGGLGVPGLLCSPGLSSGDSGGWPGGEGWPDGAWLDPTGLVDRGFGRPGLLRRWLLENDWLPPALRGTWTGPFRAILVSKWSQMGRVAGDWMDTGALQPLRSFPIPPTEVVLV